MNIPAVIHQTWKTSDVPEVMQQMAHTWKQKHPDWKYILWTDEMNRDFVATHFPAFLPVYDHYPTAIQRVDAVRYMILYRMGGVFVDLDFECLKNIASLLEGKVCVLGEEPGEHCTAHRKDKIISNAFMAAVPGHVFLKTVLEEIKTGRETTQHRFDRVLESTGPFMLTRMYDRFGPKEQVTVLPAEILYPLSKTQLENHIPPGNEAFAVHYYQGSWWKPFL